jgi:hypothetical protein
VDPVLRSARFAERVSPPIGKWGRGNRLPGTEEPLMPLPSADELRPDNHL